MRSKIACLRSACMTMAMRATFHNTNLIKSSADVQSVRSFEIRYSFTQRITTVTHRLTDIENAKRLRAHVPFYVYGGDGGGR